jgi:hypothetical protein
MLVAEATAGADPNLIMAALLHSHPIGRRGASLPSINDYDLTTRGMDVDAPSPRCPFCGRPMQFRFNELSTLQTFDCTGCQVLLNVPLQAGVPGIAVPVLARD